MPAAAIPGVIVMIAVFGAFIVGFGGALIWGALPPKRR
jgi:hypothetical protein